MFPPEKIRAGQTIIVPLDENHTLVTEPEDYRIAGTEHAAKFFLPTFSFKKK